MIDTKTQFTGSKPSLVLYLGLGMAALLKDLLDFVGIGSLPGIGTIVTFCFSFFIWMMLTLFDRSGGKKNRKQTQGLLLMLMSLVEGIGIGLNFLPLETLTVVLLYIMAKKAWEKEMKEGAALSSKQEGHRRSREIALERQRVRMEEERMRIQQEERMQKEAANEAVSQQRKIS